MWLLCTRYDFATGYLPSRIPGWQGVAQLNICPTPPPVLSAANPFVSMVDFSAVLITTGDIWAQSVLTKMTFYHQPNVTDLFVSDFKASRVYRVRNIYGVPAVEFVPTASISFANGLATYGHMLLVAGGFGDGAGLFAYNLAEPSSALVTLAGAARTQGSPVINGEVIRFDASGTYLYMAKYTGSDTNPFNECEPGSSNRRQPT